jgi:hypothetical protein
MSYDVYLYEKRFLKRALDENLGDWSGADPIATERLEIVREGLKTKGYKSPDNSEFEHPNADWGLQVCVFSGEVAFAIAYWDDADTAIGTARADALAIARDANLGFYDPQTGEAIF